MKADRLLLIVQIRALILATTGTLSKIVRDSASKLWVIYVDGTSLYIVTSTDGGLVWSDAETIVTESYSGSNGIEPDIVIDSSDIPHIVYSVRTGVSGSKRTLYYLNRSGGSWSAKEDILGVEGLYKYPRAAIDSSDDIHCVYHKGTLGAASVKYVKRTSGIWGSETNLATKYSIGIDSGYDAQDICIDSSDNIHVVYTGSVTAPDLHYRLNDGSWQSEETLAGIANSDREQRVPRIAVDSSNIVHIVWSGESYGASNPARGQICYISGNTGAWGSVTALTDVSQHQGWPYGLDIAINALDEIDICWSGARWSESTATWITGNHIKYSSGAWGSVDVFSDYNITRVHSMLWHKFPSNGILEGGYMVMYLTTALEFREGG